MYQNQELEEPYQEEQEDQETPINHAHPPDSDQPVLAFPTAPPESSTVPPMLLMRLLDTSSHLVALRNIPSLLHTILPRLTETLPGQLGGLLWICERASGQLRMVAVHGLSLQPATLEALKACSLVPGEALAGEAFQRDEPLISTTSSGYPAQRVSQRYAPLFEQFAQQLPTTLLDICVPLRAGDEPVGVIELLHLEAPPATAPGYHTSPLFIKTLQHFGSLVGAAIRNLQLYEQAERHCRRLDAFDAVVTAISTATDLRDLMRSVLDVLMGLMPVTAGAILLLVPSQARLTLGIQQHLPGDYVDTLRSMPVSGSPCEEVVRYGQPTLRHLLEERGEAALLAVGLESSAYVPLLAGGTVVGILALYGNALMPRELDMSRLMPLGNQVGFAIANVRLYEDSQLERRKLNTVMNSIAEGVVLYDSQGQILLANEAAMETLGLDSVPFQQPFSEVSAMYHIRNLDGEPLDTEMLPMARALSGTVFHDYRLIVRGADGSDSVMSFSGAPAHSEDETIEGAVIVFRDITAAQKLERAKDEFLAVAAHELRSPLAAVRSYADMLLRRERQRSESDTQDVRGLTILSQQVSHMLQMVDNLLDVSRLDAGQFDLQRQRVNLVSLISEVLDQHRHATRKQELVLETEQATCWIECDVLRIRQVLSNLVGNAIKYGPPEKPIIVRVTPIISMERVERTSTTEAADAADQQPTREVLVAVSDMGSGIPAEQQPRIFERYYRVRAIKRRGEGLGLGLYLSREFVLRHGGRIWVEGNSEGGSSFFFTLPMQSHAHDKDQELQEMHVER